MADTKTTLTWLLRDQVSGPARKMDAALGKAGATAGSSGGKFGKLGTALGGLVNPTTLVIGGVTALTGFLIASTKAAAEEEINIQKLNASLKANVPAWDGNTAAIEKLISKREDLAFTDDELRNSLALLVASTKDVSEAQDLQALAMDLARLKGVDLETATQALVKANAGSTRELKALGIVVDDTSDKTEVFTAIQKAAAGQAAAYADTTAGKWQTLGIKFGDVMEDIGAAIIPVAEGILNFSIGAIEAAGKVQRSIMAMITAIKRAISAFLNFFAQADKYREGNYANLTTSQANTLYHTGTRAHGGPVTAGGAYLVGEEGPELFMPSSSGSIIPNGGTTGSASMGGVTIQGVTESQILDMVDRGLYFRLQRAAPTAGRT